MVKSVIAFHRIDDGEIPFLKFKASHDSDKARQAIGGSSAKWS
jgi:hypothetical protein